MLILFILSLFSSNKKGNGSGGVYLKPTGTHATNPFTKGPQPPSIVPLPKDTK